MPPVPSTSSAPVRSAPSGDSSTGSAPSSLLQLARIIRRGDPVVFVTGSGLSAPSGIPTFRGAEGVWAKWVLEWGTRAAFLADPRGWYDNFWIPAHVVAEPGSTSERTYEPSAGHFAVAEVAACRQTNVHVITQNIDGLHQRAGLPSERLVEVHGRAGLLKCVSPGCRYAAAESIGPAQLDLATATAEWEADAKGPDVTPDPALRARVVVHLRLRPAGGGVRATCAVERQAAPCDPKATRTVLGALPTCPACGAPALPQALLFDEEYESHSFYQYRKARRWLECAKAPARPRERLPPLAPDSSASSSQRQRWTGACLRRHLLRRRGDGACAPRRSSPPAESQPSGPWTRPRLIHGVCPRRSGRAVAAELLLQHCARVGDAGSRGGRRARRCKAARPADAPHRRLLRGAAAGTAVRTPPPHATRGSAVPAGDSAQAGRAGRVAARRQGGGLVRGVDPSPCRGGGARGARKRLERAADGRGCGGRRARAASARQEARPREGVRAERDDVGGLRRVRQVAEAARGRCA